MILSRTKILTSFHPADDFGELNIAVLKCLVKSMMLSLAEISNPLGMSTHVAQLMLCLAWVRMSIDLVGSRVLPVMKVQVDVEGVSM